jgi:hypothetical protein
MWALTWPSGEKTVRAAGRQHAERITQYAVITDDTERENESERGAKGYSKLDARTSDDNLAPLSVGHCPLCSTSTRRDTHLGHRISTSWVGRSGGQQYEQKQRKIVTNESNRRKSKTYWRQLEDG